MRLDLKLRFRPASALYSPVTRREILLYCLFAALLFGEKVVLNGGPFLGNDSYQYLSVANNLIAGNGPQTSIIYFDTERSWHRVPASLTTFPPGYPAAIAFLHLAGIDPAAAGFLVSALAGILLIPLVYWGAWLLNYNGLVTRLLLLGLIGNAWYSFYSVFVLTESLFALVSTAAVLVLVTGLSRKQNDRKQLAWIITGHLLIGLAYWIRYAGLFLFGAVCLHFLLLTWRQREGVAWGGLAGLCVSGGIIAIGMVRNFLYVGSWRGGNDKVVAHPWFDVLENFLLQFHHLFMGRIAQPRLWLVDVLFMLGALALVGLALRTIRPFCHSALSNRLVLAKSLLMIYGLVYGIGIVYLCRTSVIDVTTRTFYPLLPCLLLTAGGLLLVLLTQCRQTLTLTLVFTLGTLYLVNNGYHYLAPAAPAPHQVIAERLASKSTTAVNLMTWIEQHVPPDATILANEGQAVGFLVQRKTVSLVSDRYGSSLSDEADVRRAMATYRASFIILIKDREGDHQFVRKSFFLNGLTEGHIPPWLELAAQTPEGIIFRCVQAQIGATATVDRVFLHLPEAGPS